MGFVTGLVDLASGGGVLSAAITARVLFSGTAVLGDLLAFSSIGLCLLVVSRIASDLRAPSEEVFARKGAMLLRGAVPLFDGIEGFGDVFLVAEALCVFEVDPGCDFLKASLGLRTSAFEFLDSEGESEGFAASNRLPSGLSEAWA